MLHGGRSGSEFRRTLAWFAVAVGLTVAALAPVGTAGATPLITGLTGTSAEGNHTCALTSAGGVECWGENDHGEVGDGTTVARTTPTPVTTTTGLTAPVAAVSAGTAHTCALTNPGPAGAVWCWGLNDHAEIGNGGTSVAGILKPSQVLKTRPPAPAAPTTLSGATAIATGSQHSCALMSSGIVVCWGRDDVGEIGDNAVFGQTAFLPTPVLSAPGVVLTSVQAIAAAGKHTCALTTAGGVKCWGLNDHGAIGDGTTTNRLVATDVSGLASGVAAISLGGDHSCALMISGGAKCWGLDSSGQLGNNSIVDALTPVDVTGLTADVTAIGAGARHTCAVTSEGGLDCWGFNSNGQLGDGTTTTSLVPEPVPGAAANVASVVGGLAHTCFALVSGPMKCWGANESGQLGNGSKVDLAGPFLPDPPGDPHAVAGDTTATVVWSPPADDGGFPITTYTVVAAPGGMTHTVDASVLSTSFTGLQNGTAYTFTVRATNSVGIGHVSTPSESVVPAGPPGAPSDLGVATADQRATVSWRTAASNGAALTGNTVTVSPGGRVVNVAGSATSVTITGLANGATYTFSLRARNRVGAGPAAQIARKLPTPKSGYWMLGANGTVYAFGNSRAMGSASYPTWPSGVSAVAITSRLDGTGYWVVDSVGNVHAFGTARVLGSRPTLRAGERVSTIAATPTGRGYYLFTNRGRAIVYGDARFEGDMSRVTLNGPIIASNATPTGRGYYMVGSDGGVFSFGDARFHGSTGGIHLNKPVVGISPTPTNGGYWLVASDGGVFAFDAQFRGSMGAVRLNKAVNGLVPLGNGYLMVASDGGVFDFSNKPFYGSLAAAPPPAPIIGIAAFVF